MFTTSPLCAGHGPILSASAQQRGTRPISPCQEVTQTTRVPAVRAATARRTGVAGRTAGATSAVQTRVDRTTAPRTPAAGTAAAENSRGGIQVAEILAGRTGGAGIPVRGIGRAGTHVARLSATETRLARTGARGIRVGRGRPGRPGIGPGRPGIGPGRPGIGPGRPGIGPGRGAPKIGPAGTPQSGGTQRQARGHRATATGRTHHPVIRGGGTRTTGPAGQRRAGMRLPGDRRTGDRRG
jgi:hypothetical protein